LAEYTAKPTLPDVRREIPPGRQPGFEEGHSFERVGAGIEGFVSPEEAYQEGLTEGERRGREAASKELSPVVEELRAAARAMAEVRAQRLESAENELLEVATEIARRILHGELQQSHDVALRMARACIQEANDEGVLVLQVSPSDAALIRTHVPDLETDLADASIRIAVDPRISAGGVVLDTPTRSYEGRPQRLLDAAVRQLEQEEAAIGGGSDGEAPAREPPETATAEQPGTSGPPETEGGAE
jgi:flagellar biosynthesis/type III secretory pathway protein FliH